MKILIITDYFAPGNDIAAVRATKLYKYWKSFGNEIVILTSLKSADTDYNFSTDNIEETDIVRLNCRVWFEKIYQKARGNQRNQNRMAASCGESKAARSNKSKLKQKIKKTVVGFYNKSRLSKFKKRAIKYIKKSKSEIDMIFSTYGPKTCHTIGSFAKKRYPGAKWIADFRDPPARKKPESASPKRAASRMCKTANAVTAVSRGCLNALQINRNVPKYVITNGFDRDDFCGITPSHDKNCFVFTYTGLIYPARRLDNFFRALYELICECVICREKITVKYAGSTPLSLFEQASKYGLEDKIQNYGLISRFKSLQLQSDSNALLLASWNTTGNKGALTGKFFEYMMTGIPIITLISGDAAGSELKEIIDRTKTGVAFEEAAGNYDELKNYIAGIYGEWHQDKKTFIEPDIDEIEKYNYKNIAKIFMEI